jgi:succinate dehydrogenase / fumarate reductase membrane anchor subunit
MASVPAPTPTPAPTGRTVRRIKPLAKPRNNLEFLLWAGMRYSGLILVFLSLSHFWMQHVVIGTHAIEVNHTVVRWGETGKPVTIENIIWRAYYAVILGLAMLHGLNGLRQVVGDYFRGMAYKVIMVAAAGLIGIVMVLGFVALAAGATLVTK